MKSYSNYTLDTFTSEQASKQVEVLSQKCNQKTSRTTVSQVHVSQGMSDAKVCERWSKKLSIESRSCNTMKNLHNVTLALLHALQAAVEVEGCRFEPMTEINVEPLFNRRKVFAKNFTRRFSSCHVRCFSRQQIYSRKFRSISTQPPASHHLLHLFSVTCVNCSTKKSE